MNSARSYNDAQLDTISRSVYYDTCKFALEKLKLPDCDDEMLQAIAAALDAAACGFDEVNEDDLSDIPAGMRQATPYNDDLLNEMSRDLYVQCIQRVQNYVQGSLTMNVDKMNAYARVADAAASGFREDDVED
jgi:hypothetical protein